MCFLSIVGKKTHRHQQYLWYCFVEWFVFESEAKQGPEQKSNHDFSLRHRILRDNLRHHHVYLHHYYHHHLTHTQTKMIFFFFQVHRVRGRDCKRKNASFQWKAGMRWLFYITKYPTNALREGSASDMSIRWYVGQIGNSLTKAPLSKCNRSMVQSMPCI